MRLLLVIVFFACSTTSFAQSIPDCNYPFNASADSLVRFVVKDVYKYTTRQEVEAKFNSKEFKHYFYNPSLSINYDSVFQECITYLRVKLGTRFLCNNISLSINSFVNSQESNPFKLDFIFTYPVIKRDTPINSGNAVSYYETTNFVFEYELAADRKLYVKYPLDIPICANKADCGIIVTRDKGLEILKAQGIVKPNDRIDMRIFGTHWDIQLTDDGWSFRKYSINIQTGELVRLKDAHRID